MNLAGKEPHKTYDDDDEARKGPRLMWNRWPPAHPELNSGWAAAPFSFSQFFRRLSTVFLQAIFRPAFDPRPIPNRVPRLNASDRSAPNHSRQSQKSSVLHFAKSHRISSRLPFDRPVLNPRRTQQVRHQKPIIGQFIGQLVDLYYKVRMRRCPAHQKDRPPLGRLLAFCALSYPGLQHGQRLSVEHTHLRSRVFVFFTCTTSCACAISITGNTIGGNSIQHPSNNGSSNARNITRL
jgi:hypothetical protein